MCVLSIKVAIRKKSGNLSYAPRIFLSVFFFFLLFFLYIYIYIYIYIYVYTLQEFMVITISLLAPRLGGL